MEPGHATQVDAAVLGQLLLMQSVLGNLPDENAIMRFVARGLRDVPGVAQAEFAATEPASAEPDRVCFSIGSGGLQWGYLLLVLGTPATFAPYEAHLRNFCFMLAVILEEQRQRRINAQHSAELEKRVTERTASLETALSDLRYEVAERLRAETALREAEAKQRAMIANIADVIAILDADGVVRYQSPNLSRWFGWSTSQMDGLSYWTHFHADDLATAQATLAHLLEAPGRMATFEGRFRCLDGSFKWIEATAINCLDTHDIGGVLLNYHDITERKRLGEEAGKLQDQLTQSQKLESIGRLAGGVAHDFNNMLSVILGNAEIAQTQIDPGHPAMSALQEILSATQRSAELARQLLAFARKQTAAPRVLDLNTTVAGMLSMLRRLIGESIELRWNPGGQLPLVKIDPTQIDQILANLAVNARDAIVAVGGVGTIMIATSQVEYDAIFCADHPSFSPGRYLLLTVSDTGCGMSKEVQDRLFEPFFTTKGLGAGTGLGLATVYGIVKQNDGVINVYSEPKHGAAFKIYLPACDSQEVSAPHARPVRPPPGQQETILVVEDDPALLRMTQKHLVNLGYTVLAARRPGEAIHLAEEHAGKINLLMTDVVMPEMNGRDLALRLTANCPQLRQLYMSGYTADVIAHQGVLEEGVNYLAKPFTVQELAVKVHSALYS